MSELMNQKVEVTCTCGSRLRVTLRDVRYNRTVRCSRGHMIELHDEGGGVRRADRAMDDLDRSIRDLNRRLRRL